MLKRALPAVLLLLAVPGAARPQDVDEREVEFARGLVRRRYFDLANEVCDRMGKNPGVEFVRAEILVEQAQAESDIVKVREGIDAAVKKMQTFLSANPAHPRAGEAQGFIGWLQKRKAQLITVAIKLETDPKKHDALLHDARQIYADVEKSFQDTLDKLKAGDKVDTPDYWYAFLELARTHLDHAKLPGLDGEERKRMLTETASQLYDFGLDNGGRVPAYEASWIKGQCYTELGDYEKAISSLQGAIDLRRQIADAGRKPDPEYHLPIIHGALIALAQAYVAAGKPKEAEALIDQALKDEPGVERERDGLTMLLEKAQALFVQGRAPEATALAKKVETADANGPMGYAARERMRSWTAGGGARTRLLPENLMTAAEAAFDKKQWHETLRALRQCVELCATPEDREKYMASAYYKMGQCLGELHRNYEAACAYENVFRFFPKNELSSRACYEAAHSYIKAKAFSDDPKDVEMVQKYSTTLARTWPDDPVAQNILIAPAEEAENAKEYKKAAELYMKIPERAEAYETALVRAGYCYSRDALARWPAAKTDAAKAEAKKEMLDAADALRKFLARTKDPAKTPKQPELVKIREGLAFIAYDRLAAIYTHEAVNKSDECLQILDEYVKALPTGDDRLGKILGLKVRPLLVLNRFDEAVQTVDLLFEKFPDSPSLPPAAKSVGIALDKMTRDLIEKKTGTPEAIVENLKKVSKYYYKWIIDGPAVMSISGQEALYVAEALYLNARRINGLDDKTVSFLDMKGKPVKAKSYFTDAAFVHTFLADGKVVRLSDAERADVLTRLARCWSFTAANAADWQKAKGFYNDVVKAAKLVDASERINGAVLGAKGYLLGVYLELGYSYIELARRAPNAAVKQLQFDNASTVFNNVVGVTQAQSEPWWNARYMGLAILVERGAPKDVDLAKVGLDLMEKSNPDFDGGQFGMKQKFADLRREITRVVGK